MSIELKIKIKNLADEARTIRVEENKLHGMAKWNLQHHRKTVVRDAARRSQIAYQHCRNRDPSPNMAQDSEEFNGRCRSDWSHVEKMVKKYGDENAVERLADLKALMSG